MRAIIPVAGIGSRLKPHTHTIPKVLLNVGGKPILGHIVEKLQNEGINKATFVYGHLGEKVQEYITTFHPLLHADFVEQKSPEGLGHAIYTAIPTFDEEEIFIILGDTIFDVELKSVFYNKISSLGVKEVADPSRFGVAITENGIIKKLIEKPKEPISNLALVGLYYISNRQLLTDCLNELVNKNIRTRGELQLTDALQLMIDKGELFQTFPVEGWYDCGKPETLLSTNQFLLHQSGTYSPRENVIIHPPVHIANSAVVKDSVIGPYTTIGENAVVIESLIRNSIIGENSEIKCSMLNDSIIGNNSLISGSYKRLNSGDSTEIEFY